MDEESKDVTHQKQHSKKPASDDQQDPNNDIPYAQHYSLEKHTQQTERSA